MKKLLALVAILALVAAMVVPMAAFAYGGSSTVAVTADWVAPTVTFTAPGSSINLGTLYPNTTTAWGYTGVAGSVSFVQGSDTGATYVLSVSSPITGNWYDGHMQTSADWSYLANPLYVALGTESSVGAVNVDTDGATSWTYGNLPAGPASFTVPTTGVLYYFDVAAQQVMTAAIPTAGTYGITINVNATYAP
jgi:hypothetical protein